MLASVEVLEYTKKLADEHRENSKAERIPDLYNQHRASKIRGLPSRQSMCVLIL